MERKLGELFSSKENLRLWEFYEVTWHDNNCPEDCPGFVTEDVMQFRGVELIEGMGLALTFAEPDEDDPDTWLERKFYWYETDMEFKLVIQ
jgi:hypothetical protein